VDQLLPAQNALPHLASMVQVAFLVTQVAKHNSALLLELENVIQESASTDMG